LIVFDLCIFGLHLFVGASLVIFWSLLCIKCFYKSIISRCFHWTSFSVFLLFCSWKWIRIWVYQVFTQFNKKCFTQILKIFHLVNN
jgi:hypothetical protein